MCWQQKVINRWLKSRKLWLRSLKSRTCGLHKHVHHILGVKVIQDMESGQVWIGQPAYSQKGLAEVCPVDVSSKLNGGIRKQH